ncbi:MAG: tetratricopeptide repeat protein [Planctomycetota bacterium]
MRIAVDRASWLAWVASLSLVGAIFLVVPGCANHEKSVESSTAADNPTARPSVTTAEEALVLRIDEGKRIEAEPPLGIEADAVRVLQGWVLARAQTPLPDVRAMLPLPEGLDDPAEEDQGEPVDEPTQEADASEEPSLQTQRLFAVALQQGLQGQGSQAVRLLEAAARQTPDNPTLLRRLALGWAGLGNRVRAAAYFRQAVASNPADLESLVALGRLLVESGEIDLGAGSLLYALEREATLAEIDVALPLLTRFYASGGLRRAGYTQASADLLDAFLDAPPPQNLRPTRYGAELMFLLNRAAVHEVARGDLQAKLGNFRNARLAYESAARLGASGDDLTRRVVYADLWLGRLDEATALVIGAVAANPASPAALGMIEYLIEQGVPAKPIVEALRALPEDEDEPGGATLALASALPRGAAIELLGETLDETPAAERVYQRQLTLLFDDASSPADVTQAVERTVAAIDADPVRAPRFAGTLLATAGQADAVLDGFDGLDSELRETPAAQTLEAVVLIEIGETEAAQAKLDAALASDAPPPLATIERARLLAISGNYVAAQAMLDTLEADASDVRLGQLRVAVLLELNRTDEALVLLDQLIVEQPGDVRLAIQKSGVLVRQERFAEAEQTLLDTVTANPRAEPAYAALLELYDRHGNALPDHPKGYQRLVHRMLTTIPRSRISRLTNAGILEVRGNLEQAERLLDGLLAENPNDRDALLVLIDVYHKTDRRDEADDIVERLLNAEPQNPEVLRAAMSHYRRTRNEEGLAQVEERWLRAQEPSVQRDLGLARLLLEQGRQDEAFRLLDDAAERAEPEEQVVIRFFEIQAMREFPLDLAEARLQMIVSDDGLEDGVRKAAAYTLATQYESAGRGDDTDALYEAMLDALPDDAELKNHVGYTWAHAGRHLERAEALIADALEAEKDQSAYLDSMGWVRYKQGDLMGAEQWLRRAMEAPGGDNPVILDHMGDVLYRLGRTAEAKGFWRQARDGMDDPRNQSTGDPETETVVERTTAKLAAVDGGADAEVPVASLGPGVVAEAVDEPAAASDEAP